MLIVFDQAMSEFTEKLQSSCILLTSVLPPQRMVLAHHIQCDALERQVESASLNGQTLRTSAVELPQHLHACSAFPNGFGNLRRPFRLCSCPIASRLGLG